MVETSVAVAMPSTTAKRMTKGRISAGSAMAKVRPISPRPARRTAERSSPRERHQATAASANASTNAGRRPPVNKAAIDTPVTEPMVMRTRLGGIVSDMAPDDDRSAISSPGLAPRAFISGNSTGATAAMSAALAPEMPDTRKIAPSST